MNLPNNNVNCDFIMHKINKLFFQFVCKFFKLATLLPWFWCCVRIENFSFPTMWPLNFFFMWLCYLEKIENLSFFLLFLKSFLFHFVFSNSTIVCFPRFVHIHGEIRWRTLAQCVFGHLVSWKISSTSMHLYYCYY